MTVNFPRSKVYSLTLFRAATYAFEPDGATPSNMERVAEK